MASEHFSEILKFNFKKENAQTRDIKMLKTIPLSPKICKGSKPISNPSGGSLAPGGEKNLKTLKFFRKT